MANHCTICLQPLLQLAKTKGQSNIDKARSDASELRQVIATKCGHVFHADCLKEKFAQKSIKAWNPQKCPSNACSSMINIKIDTIVIHANQMDRSGMMVRGEAEAQAGERLRFYETENKELKETCHYLHKQAMEARAAVDKLVIEMYELEKRCRYMERLYAAEVEQKLNRDEMFVQMRQANIGSMQYPSSQLHMNGPNGFPVRGMHDAPHLPPQNPNLFRGGMDQLNFRPPPGFDQQESLNGQAPLPFVPTPGHRNPRFERPEMFQNVPKLNPAYGQDIWNRGDRGGNNMNGMNLQMNQQQRLPPPIGYKNEMPPLAHQGQQILRMIQKPDSDNEISFKSLMRESAEPDILPLAHRQFNRSKEPEFEPKIKEPLFRALYEQPYPGLGMNNRCRNTASPDDKFMQSLVPAENDITEGIQNVSLNLSKPPSSPEDNRSPDETQNPRPASSASSEFVLTWSSDESAASSSDEQSAKNGKYGKKKDKSYESGAGNQKGKGSGSGSGDSETRRPFRTTYGRFNCKKCKVEWGAKIQPAQKLNCRYCNTLTSASKEEEYKNPKNSNEQSTGKTKEKMKGKTKEKRRN